MARTSSALKDEARGDFLPLILPAKSAPLRHSLARGILFGAAAALVVSVLWGLLAYQAQPLLVALISGYAISWAVLRGAGKLSSAVALIASGLSLAAVIAGDILYFSFSAMRELGVPLSYDLISGVGRDIVALELLDSNIILVFVAVLCGGALALYTERRRSLSLPRAAVARLYQMHRPGVEEHKGATESDRPDEPTPVSMQGQLLHRTADEMLKDADTDLPG